jgi:hypothetical protein
VTAGRHRLAALGLAALGLAALGLAACVRSSQIGPFVKTITRDGNALSIVSCDIVLEGHELYEGQCYAQRITLSQLPPSADLPDPPPPSAPAH